MSVKGSSAREAVENGEPPRKKRQPRPSAKKDAIGEVFLLVIESLLDHSLRLDR